MQRGDFVGGDSRRSGVADVEVTLEVELLSAFITRYQGRPLTRSFVFIYDCLLVEYPVHNVGRPLTSLVCSTDESLRLLLHAARMHTDE